MAKSLLNWKERRSLLDSGRPDEVLNRAGHEMLEQGHLSEAAEFFQKTGCREGLKSLLKKTIEEGNFFLYNTTLSILAEKPQVQELALLAAAAETQGLKAYQQKAVQLMASLAGPAEAVSSDGDPA
ncbi:MAG: hypothetical protein LBK52_02475 [Deltaproteobacteria bacterium]|jgi:hypothetical protein|nr:hypothetical protein [Deltaproteobacteria bacterium]